MNTGIVMDVWAQLIGILMVAATVVAFFFAPSGKEKEPLYVRQIVASVFAFSTAAVCASLFYFSPSDTEGTEIAFAILSAVVMIAIPCWYAIRSKKNNKK